MKKCIYMIRNDINNKVYIGQAIDVKQRFQSHCKPSAWELNNDLVGKAIQKYGKEHFVCEVLVYDTENYDVHNGKLSNRDINEIIERLKTSYDSFELIAQSYGVGYKAIARINKGISHRSEKEVYPIRTSKPKGKTSKFTYEQITEITNMLLNTKLSLREIGRLYHASYDDIVGIKNGRFQMYRRSGLTYPLRKNN